jgi:hypothetical protein
MIGKEMEKAIVACFQVPSQNLSKNGENNRTCWSACRLLPACFFLGLLFDSEEGDDKLLRNVDGLLLQNMFFSTRKIVLLVLSAM